MKTEKKRNFGLDLLRAIAIIAVLVSHSDRFAVAVLGPYVKWMKVGFGGVEIFFVLSGYLIGGFCIKLLKTHTLALLMLLTFGKEDGFVRFPIIFSFVFL